MTIVASAPGKVMLLGEYAVLDGAPALVAAIDRRAIVRLTPRTDDVVHVDAPDLGIRAHGRMGPDGALHWTEPDDAASRLRLVTGVYEAVRSGGARHEGGVMGGGFDAHLSTGEFFDASRTKLGLGSSSALTVALAGALHAAAGLTTPTLAALVDCHRTVQGGRGSGADIAAALTGGVLAYSGADTDAPVVEPVAVPVDLHWCAVYTGRSTSTASYLNHVAQWREAHPAEYSSHMSTLTTTACAGANAVRHGDATTLLSAIERYGAQLRLLGEASGIDITSAEHRDVGNLARKCGVSYKPSGAGGGDIGIGMARDVGHIRAFRDEVTRAGYRTIDMTADPRGLAIASDGPPGDDMAAG